MTFDATLTDTPRLPRVPHYNAKPATSCATESRLARTRPSFQRIT